MLLIDPSSFASTHADEAALERAHWAEQARTLSAGRGWGNTTPVPPFSHTSLSASLYALSGSNSDQTVLAALNGKRRALNACTHVGSESA